MTVRTRIAPSPTGYPHIGTIYQVLFDYAFAKKYNGQFIIRIEDTDRERFVADAEEKIYQAFDWFGLTEDESPRKSGQYKPYRQSERLEIYKKYAQELVDKGYAYYCYCSKERLEEVRKQMQKEGKSPMYDKHCRNIEVKNPAFAKASAGKKNYVIRMKVPENSKIKIKDEIRGEIEFDSASVDDQVILKTDGYPTYHLAVVVDDHLMKITHIVRGEEWLSSTPKHFLLYEYFGWEKPLFFHTPVLRNPDKSKLSKRHGHTNVAWYREQGYLPEAILNFLALMGWSHPEQKEIFSLDEFIKLVELKDLKAIGPIFDLVKLEWMNGMYIRETQNSKLKFQILEYIGKEYSEDIVEKTIPLIKERIKKFSDYLPLCGFFFKQPTAYDIEMGKYKETLKTVYKSLNNIQEWNVMNIGQVLVKTANELGIKNSEFFMMLRVAITGKKISPPLNESMEILGKEECLTRIQILTTV